MIQIINEPQQRKDEGKPHVVMLLDESGSMREHQKSVVDTANEFMNSVRDTAETISLYTFDSKGVRMKINKIEPTHVISLTLDDYKPDALTPLYDAIGAVIMRYEAGQKVQFVIHTDGGENNSKEWTFEGLNSLIKQRTDGGWLFVYLGEGIVAQQELEKFTGGVKMNFSSAMRGQTMKATADVTRAYSAYNMSEQDAPIAGTVDIDKGESI